MTQTRKVAHFRAACNMPVYATEWCFQHEVLAYRSASPVEAADLIRLGYEFAVQMSLLGVLRTLSVPSF